MALSKCQAKQENSNRYSLLQGSEMPLPKNLLGATQELRQGNNTGGKASFGTNFTDRKGSISSDEEDILYRP